LYVAESEERIHSDAWQQRVDRTGAVYGEEKMAEERERVRGKEERLVRRWEGR
jgi:hypothetical protein